MGLQQIRDVNTPNMLNHTISDNHWSGLFVIQGLLGLSVIQSQGVLLFAFQVLSGGQQGLEQLGASDKPSIQCSHTAVVGVAIPTHLCKTIFVQRYQMPPTTANSF
ncbi:hypothetical protein IV203_036839 [Nitzschia inconspicua]|uniref:Uncharacterized protein n=1 Tax=Nitzschia inconspicua TaxID=303405 RepID=A0A9K3PW16_9STRA|nr:hypothetical protein IV203_036839 [Nitzschia inconspicua]